MITVGPAMASMVKVEHFYQLIGDRCLPHELRWYFSCVPTHEEQTAEVLRHSTGEAVTCIAIKSPTIAEGGFSSGGRHFCVGH